MLEHVWKEENLLFLFLIYFVSFYFFGLWAYIKLEKNICSFKSCQRNTQKKANEERCRCLCIGSSHSFLKNVSFLLNHKYWSHGSIFTFLQPTTTTKILVDDDEGVCFSFFLPFFPLSIFSTISYRHSITHTPSFKHHSVGRRCRHILLAIPLLLTIYTSCSSYSFFFTIHRIASSRKKERKKNVFSFRLLLPCLPAASYFLLLPFSFFSISTVSLNSSRRVCVRV